MKEINLLGIFWGILEFSGLYIETSLELFDILFFKRKKYKYFYLSEISYQGLKFFLITH